MSAAPSVTIGAGGDTPGAVLRVVERRLLLSTAAVLVGLALVAWWLTVQQALEMSDMVTGLAQVGTRMANPMAAPLFMLMWLTMMVAMMFPTIVPIVLAHRLVVRQRGDGILSTGSFVFGYIAVWTAIGCVPLGAFLAFRGIGEDATVSPWLPRSAGLILLVAGLYQFTPWKRLCLRACRTPLGFMLTHNFGSGARGAFQSGLAHGAYCLGCCWALMTVLVVMGLMNLVWMAALALIFLAEKNWRYGVVLNRIAGSAVALLGCAVLIYPELLALISG